MTIQELREARNKAWQGAKAFVESRCRSLCKNGAEN